ncbi:MAG: GNAT family N-acetyltransferase [Saprospiraceae bacterium]|nr:GNAT family N-acetyltransferase [Saprospiraceae bacterium]
MHIRQATISDLTAIVQLLADDELGKTRENFQLPLPDVYLQAFAKIDADPYQYLLVVEGVDATIIGTMQLSFIPYLTYQGGLRAQIEAVRIQKEHRGSGLGTKMFQYAIDLAKAKGAHVLQLTTDKKRPQAKRFYESLGFVASHEGMKLHFY